MRNFYNFMRHIQLINWRIITYSFNELKCIIKGDGFEPSFNSQTMLMCMEDLKKGTVKAFPMGAYEYDCCVEYLKMIRHQLVTNLNNFALLTLVFGESSFGDVINVPLEDCLDRVAEEVGFKVISENANSKNYQYTLKSMFWERR